jgi:hypothetical protein
MRPYGPDVNGFKEGSALLICQNQTLYNKRKMPITMEYEKGTRCSRKEEKERRINTIATKEWRNIST